MKADIHPTYHEAVTATCACGATYAIGSTHDSIFVELCKACHPFYTGKQKILDTARRVEKFQSKATKKSTATLGHKAKLEKSAARAKKREEKKAKGA